MVKSLKVIVGISNIFLYTSFIFAFVGFGLLKIGKHPALAFSVSASILSFLFLFIYFLLKKQTTKIQRVKYKKNKLEKKFIVVFYTVSLFFMCLSLFYFGFGYAMIVKPATYRIMFYVFFPIVVFGAFTASVMESIVNVREQIFIYKTYIKSQKKEEKLKSQPSY